MLAMPVLAKEQYIKRHDSVCAELHCKVSKEIAAQLDTGQWCEHVLTLVQTGHEGTVAILWNEAYRLTEQSMTVNWTA